jgi:hypothetical protein
MQTEEEDALWHPLSGFRAREYPLARKTQKEKSVFSGWTGLFLGRAKSWYYSIN